MKEFTKEEFEQAMRYFTYAQGKLSDMQHQLYDLCYYLRQTKYDDAELLNVIFGSFKNSLDDWDKILAEVVLSFETDHFKDEWNDDE